MLAWSQSQLARRVYDDSGVIALEHLACLGRTSLAYPAWLTNASRAPDTLRCGDAESARFAREEGTFSPSGVDDTLVPQTGSLPLGARQRRFRFESSRSRGLIQEVSFCS